MRSQYSILIQWSEPDKTYLVTLPEVGSYSHTHGETYQEALKNIASGFPTLIASFFR
jgi:antitoxin HicB